MASSDRLSIFRSRQYAPTTNPPAGTNFLYPKADGKWYSRDASGVETLVGNAPVTSVAGKTGAVVLAKADVGLGSVQNVDSTNAANLAYGTVPDPVLPGWLFTQSIAGDATSANSSGRYWWTTADTYLPVTGACGLEVVALNQLYFTQTAYALNGDTYRRSFNNPLWTPWVRVATANDLAAKTDKDSTASASMRSQDMLTGGGTLAVDLSNRISWSQRFVANNKGNGAHFSTAGYFDITLPPNGTVITGVGGAPNQTVAGGVITLPSWTSLYYILPIGSGSASVPANFRLVLNSSGLVIPDHWVEVAELNSDNLQVRWANGVSLYQGRSWSALDPRSSVALGNVDNTSDVNKPVSTAVQTALNLKNASGLPTYAGARTNPFNPATSWYNLTPATQHIIRATMAKADVQRVRITAMGHSMLAGAFASQVGSTDTVATLRRYLGGLGANIGGTGVVKIANNTTLDYRWVLTGTWSRPNGSAPNDTADPFATATAANSTATFTSDMPGTVVDVHTFDNTAAMQIYVDDVLVETYVPQGGTGLNVTRTYTGLANTKHVVKIIATTAASTYVVGVNVRKTVGVEVSNMGQAGSSAADWAAGVNYINRQVAMADAPPHIAIMQLDTNEVLWGGPTPIATYKTNYGNLIAAVQATGAAVILVASPPATGGTGANGYPAVSQATWESYVTAEYDLADQYNVALLDLNHLFISQATASTDGLWGDPIHLNDYGYGLVARSLGTSAVWGQSNDKALDQQISLTAEYATTPPATPATGVTLFSRFRGRRMPAFVGPTGQDTHLQPALFSNMVTWLKAVSGSTTPTVDGLAVTHLNNATATPTARTISPTAFFTSLARYGVGTTAVAGTGGGTRTNVAQWQFNSTANLGGFFFVARFGFQNITAASRGFVGLSSTTTALSPTVDPSTLLVQCGFGFDAADTNLQFMTNGSSGTATKVDLGANFPKVVGQLNHFYEVRMFVPSGAGQVLYWCAIRLNDNYVVQGGPVTTKLPAVQLPLAAHFHVANNTSATAQSVEIQSLYIESDN